MYSRGSKSLYRQQWEATANALHRKFEQVVPPHPHLHHPLVSVGRVVSQLETSALGNERYTLFHFCFYFHYYKR